MSISRGRSSVMAVEDNCGPHEHRSVLARPHPKLYYSQDQRTLYDLPPYHHPPSEWRILFLQKVLVGLGLHNCDNSVHLF